MYLRFRTGRNCIRGSVTVRDMLVSAAFVISYTHQVSVLMYYSKSVG